MLIPRYESCIVTELFLCNFCSEEPLVTAKSRSDLWPFTCTLRVSKYCWLCIQMKNSFTLSTKWRTVNEALHLQSFSISLTQVCRCCNNKNCVPSLSFNCVIFCSNAPPSDKSTSICNVICTAVVTLQTQYLSALIIIPGDFNHITSSTKGFTTSQSMLAPWCMM